MADGNSLLNGDVLIITFSNHTKRIKLYYYHHEADFKEVKNLPIVKNIAQLQPIIFQFIEDFLRSRIEIAFEQSDVLFNSEKLLSNILLIVDSNLTSSFRTEIEDFYLWVLASLKDNEFHKILVEKSFKNHDTNKFEKVIDTLFADYHLSVSLLDAQDPSSFKTEQMTKSGEIDFKKLVFSQLVLNEVLQKCGTVTKVTKENVQKEAFKIADKFITSKEKTWNGELNVANKPITFQLTSQKLALTISEKEKTIKENKSQLQLVIPYNDINHLFSLLNNRKISVALFKDALDESFGQDSSEALLFFLNLGEKISPKETVPTKNNKISAYKEFIIDDFLDVGKDEISIVDKLISGKHKKESVTIKEKPKRKWVLFAALFILVLTVVFAIPAIISPPVQCNGNPLLLEIVKGNTQQVKKMVLACADYRNPEQQVITINQHDYTSPIILAIANGDLDLLAFLNEKGEIPLNAQEKNTANPALKGWSAPWTAVAFNKPKVLDYLIEQRVNMDTRQEKNGETPLIHAITLNNKYLVNKLLGAGADPDFSDSKGSTPLLYTLALDLPDLAKILLSNGATIPPFLTKNEFNSRIESDEMRKVVNDYGTHLFSFLDAFQANSPFNRNINGSFINENEHLVFNNSLFRMYPFDLSPQANYQFSCFLSMPITEESGDFGVIFSSSKNNKWSITINATGKWQLKNNKETIKSGSIELKRNVKEVRLRIKKDENQFEFRLNDSTLLTTTLPNPPGNYFGFQVENNYQGSQWIIKKYKLKEF
ncbi:MAG: ankyrin repeat domain-containing protein [Saprospiraceae bacterium]|nr:ankyrin repeat domain-containing protein [Saprospiraceae bacterium]